MLQIVENTTQIMQLLQKELQCTFDDILVLILHRINW